MARKRIIRTVNGAKWDPSVHRAEPGGTSVKSVVHVEFPDGRDNDVDLYEIDIYNTAMGHTELHQSNKVTGAPAGYLGYIHRGGGAKVCFAVTYLNTTAGYVRIGAVGQVQNGWHNF